MPLDNYGALSPIPKVKLNEPWHIFAIGDIHGMFDKLMDLWGQIEDRIAKMGSEEERRNTLIISLGDLIDRGPKSAEVVDWFMNNRHGRKQLVIRGNHEDMPCNLPGLWMSNGGQSTIDSFRTGQVVPGAWAGEPEAASDENSLPENVIEWFRKLPLGARIGKFLFVHAGLNPRKKSIAEQEPEDLMWIRNPFLNHQGKWPNDYFVVHGHTPVPYDPFHEGKMPQNDPSTWHSVRTGNRINMDTGACWGGPLSAVHIDSLNGIVEVLEAK